MVKSEKNTAARESVNKIPQKEKNINKTDTSFIFAELDASKKMRLQMTITEPQIIPNSFNPVVIRNKTLSVCIPMELNKTASLGPSEYIANNLFAEDVIPKK
jgi:hypothetical protein